MVFSLPHLKSHFWSRHAVS